MTKFEPTGRHVAQLLSEVKPDRINKSRDAFYVAEYPQKSRTQLKQQPEPYRFEKLNLSQEQIWEFNVVPLDYGVEFEKSLN